MSTLPLLALALGLAAWSGASDAVDLTTPPPTKAELEKQRADARRSIKLYRTASRAGREKMRAKSKAEYAALSPEDKKLVDALAEGKAERCGMCRGFRETDKGLVCRRMLRPMSNCGEGDCGEDIVLLGPEAYRAATEGRVLDKHELEAAAQRAQELNGVFQWELRASAIATCRCGSGGCGGEPKKEAGDPRGSPALIRP